MNINTELFSKEELSFLTTYLNTASPTGFESAGQQVWLDFLKPYIDTYQTDNYGTAYGIINPESDYKVVIEAHADEISWFVKHITSDGFIYVTRNGGSDHLIAPSKRVNIHTDKGIVKGVFGWPAIHTRRNGEKEATPSLDNIFIDVGCTSKDEVLELGVHVGCVIVFEDELMCLNNRYFTGRALDNRIGGFMIAMVAKRLQEKGIQLPFGLYIVNSVQEEVGLRGAEMITQTIKPNVAIVTDVGHDTNTPMLDHKKLGDFKCGNGPILTTGPAVHNNLLKLIMEAANESEIEFQREAASRFTGTDTDAFAFSNGGVPSALISLPLRYMHTTVESVSIEDVNKVIELIMASLQKIQYQHDFRYIK